MSRKQGYIITTRCLHLRCKHPEWLSETQDFYNQIQKFYYDLFLEHQELKEENSQVCLREMELLSIKGRDGKEFPEEAQLMSPSVVLDQKFEMLHVPVKEVVQDASTVKERIAEGRNVGPKYRSNVESSSKVDKRHQECEKSYVAAEC